MSIFKDFLDAVAAGQTRNDLFIVCDHNARSQVLQELFDEGNARNLPCAMNRARQVVTFMGASIARVRSPYPNLGDDLAGCQFTAVHGLDHLYALENAEHIKTQLESRVRSVP